MRISPINNFSSSSLVKDRTVPDGEALPRKWFDIDGEQFQCCWIDGWMDGEERLGRIDSHALTGPNEHFEDLRRLRLLQRVKEQLDDQTPL